ncbi:MAG: hypothetical protein EA365_03440 [Gloeocapsa sp. DLM2.Bin57]|nr:MAG: hypothetical protein EA365_03440 [Gloeocapsa sp. DLM2.Bin57]
MLPSLSLAHPELASFYQQGIENNRAEILIDKLFYVNTDAPESISIPVLLNQSPRRRVGVNYIIEAISDDNVVNRIDRGRIRFNPGEISQTIDINVTDNNQILQITLNRPGSADLFSDQATIILGDDLENDLEILVDYTNSLINDSEQIILVENPNLNLNNFYQPRRNSRPSVMINESIYLQQSSTETVEIPVFLNKTLPRQRITVDYTIKQFIDEDFVEVDQGRIRFNPGEILQTIVIDENDLSESLDYFEISLDRARRANIFNDIGNVIIENTSEIDATREETERLIEEVDRLLEGFEPENLDYNNLGINGGSPADAWVSPQELNVPVPRYSSGDPIVTGSGAINYGDFYYFPD